MYAVVATGGKQLKVEKDSVAVIEKLDAEVGDSVTLPVLFVSDGESVVLDPAVLASAKVTGTVIAHEKGKKQVVFKFKKRKGYKRTKGHRQVHTLVEITGITLGGDKPAAKVPAAKKAEAAKPAAKKPAAKKAAPAPVAPEATKEPTAADSTSVAALCAATKADGSPCTNKAKEGSVYCGVHAKKLEA
jgi:large subunit ribosomal protein L21